MRKTLTRTILVVLPLLALMACEPDPGDTAPIAPDDTAPETWGLDDLGGSCGYADHLGRFELAHWDGPDEGFATVTGAVLDGVIPITVLEEVASEAGCTLWRKNNPFCEELCQPDEACNHDGECEPYPMAQDLGPVQVDGLAVPLTLTADGFGNYWDTSVGYPMFEPGAHITLTAADRFELRGLGVERIEVAEPNWLLEPGVDMPVSWTVPTVPGRVAITFNIDQHGTSPLTMICELPDTGSASIPAALLGPMVDNGVSGYPSAWIRRRTADRVAISDGCTDLLVYSHRAVDMAVEGYTPCNGDLDCPDGQHCDIERQICEDD